MGKKFSPADLELYQRTDEVLHYIWDPIGVASAPSARDEYHAYLPQVFGLLKEAATVQRIATYLESVSVERMGLPATPGRATEIAELLLEWREVLIEKHSSEGNEAQ